MLDAVTLTTQVFNMSAAPHWVAVDKGFFAEEGVRVTIEGGAGDAVEWLDGPARGRTVFLIPLGGSAPFAAARKGRRLCNVIATQDRAAHVFVAGPGIHSPADLRGKTIMVGGGDPPYVDAFFVLRHFGVDPLREVRWVFPGSSGGDTARVKIESLKRGDVDAECLLPPHWFMAMRMGFTRLPSARDLASWAENGLITSREVVEKRPETVKRVVRGLIRGVEFARMNREETLDILSRYCGYADRDALEGCYDAIRHQWHVTADEDLYRRTVELFCREYDLPSRSIDDYFELRFVRESLAELRL